MYKNQLNVISDDTKKGITVSFQYTLVHSVLNYPARVYWT